MSGAKGGRARGWIEVAAAFALEAVGGRWGVWMTVPPSRRLWAPAAEPVQAPKR